jgi:hypothetical protein
MHAFKTPLALLLATAVNCAAAQTFSFGLWGDMPYARNQDGPKMPALLQSINQASIDFSIYDGDIKDGSSLCNDAAYTEALQMFNSMHKPLLYVPGDNEWTDCHRLNNGGYDNLERLSHLRRVMYPSLRSLGKTTLPLEHQGALTQAHVENIRLLHKGIVFVGLNMPGSNNNKVLSDKECQYKSARTLAQCAADNAEFEERDAANVAWMKSSFDKAQKAKAKGVVLVVQADPSFDLPETPDADESKDPLFSGFRHFMSELVSATEQFEGQVLFVHGDTHYFKVDKPLYHPEKILPNFTRLQTFGSPGAHWVKVDVDLRDPQVFVIKPVMVKQP